VGLVLWRVFVLTMAGMMFSAWPGAAQISDEIDLLNCGDLQSLQGKTATLSAGPAHDLFAGFVAAREGQDRQAIGLLEGALPELRTTQPAAFALGLRTLANLYDRLGQYGRSDALYSELSASGLLKLLPEGQRRGAHDDAELAHILAKTPPQTITWRGPVHLKTSRANPLGIPMTELLVNGVQAKWLLDTGANQSVVTRSLARRLGLKPLPGVAHTSSGVSGIENAIGVAVLPLLPLSGADVRNMPVLLLDDDSLAVSDGMGHRFQIAGIIGLPVLRGLGRVTFHRSGGLDATQHGGDPKAGVALQLRLLNPVLEARVEGQRLLFTVDTGASSTVLSVRFAERFRAQQGAWKSTETRNAGAGGATTMKSFLVPSTTFVLGERSFLLKDLPVQVEPQHAGIDALFGNVGQDLLQTVQSVTLDFKQMRLVMGEP